MGTHGRTGLGRLLMGSVAEVVVRRAPCPVLTVKTPLRESLPTSQTPVEAKEAVRKATSGNGGHHSVEQLVTVALKGLDRG